ncbi:MAG: iron-siderophore ABC transporter substrate-binding protein [Hyphomicrobium sp.]
MILKAMKGVLVGAVLALAAATGVAAQAFPVTVAHEFGETVVEQKPQRIVAVGYRDSDFLYALGIAPVGVRDWWGGHPYAAWPWAEPARKAAGATPEVFSGDELNYEWIVALDPDLILAVYMGAEQADYDRLSAIAPTIAQPAGYPLWGVPWPEEARIIDLATSGNTDKADAMIADIGARMEAARAQYPELQGKTGTIVYYNVDNVFGAWGSTDVASRFLIDLGLVFPPELDAIAAPDSSITISPELLRLIDQDVMVWPIDNPADGVQAAVEAMPLYQNLGLAREGRSVWLDDGNGVLSAALSYQSPLSIAYLIDILPPLLSAAVDGDPATPVPAVTLPPVE